MKTRSYRKSPARAGTDRDDDHAAAVARVRRVVDEAKRARDPSIVVAAIDTLADLDDGAYAQARAELVQWRADAKVTLSVRDLDRAVKGERRRRAQARRDAEAQRGPRTGELPRIIVTGRPMRDVTDAGNIALAKANRRRPELFVRSGGLVRVLVDEKSRARIGSATESFYRGALDRAAQYVADGRDGTETLIPPPLDNVRDGYARDINVDLERLGEDPLPPLLGIIDTPVMRPDGTVLRDVGYDRATGLFRSGGGGAVPVPDQPSRADVAAAVNLLTFELLGEFPFADDASRANAVAALLTVPLRPMIDGSTPLTAFDKPQPGTGGSKVAEAIAIIATGDAEMAGAPTGEDEWRK